MDNCSERSTTSVARCHKAESEVWEVVLGRASCNHGVSDLLLGGYVYSQTGGPLWLLYTVQGLYTYLRAKVKQTEPQTALQCVASVYLYNLANSW